MTTIAVVGASLAGISATRALRAQGYRGRLVIIGDEGRRPYDRPPLSKNFLTGRITAVDLALESDDEALEAEWFLGVAATGLDTRRRVISCRDGRTVAYDSAIIATGARARMLPAAVGLGNVHTLRTLEDAERLEKQLAPGRRLVVVGAGFVGAEVAATARGIGMEVTLIGSGAFPLSSPLGLQMGALIGRLHEDNGVRLIGSARVASFVCEDAMAGKARTASAVRLADGRTVRADVVVLGLGSMPNTDWLTGSGLDLTDGIRCDAAGRTGVRGVFAVGDCSAWFDDRSGAYVRDEHWTGAMERPGRAVAALLADAATAHGAPPATGSGALDLPYFWSDQYGARLQFTGSASDADSVEIEAGDPAEHNFLAVYYRAGKAVAILGVNQPRLFTRWRKALTGATPKKRVLPGKETDATSLSPVC
ncbi:NAD(P)/FAD-dependent oxidoreductase [Arthrobacter sp. H14-L1]|uniref:NAD(P)/FAD-dependent oxidoreductase n=1 Tax=Arthrobacter sp. H14-L1 TaxID=2996697 RepID=UPI00226E6B7A|nr:FAD-dependent oxidoreductase [Arthrobacter sp. H14-L1]MCY0904838.1 FAD-dependent oxidoreductase [Arthrobacter sp. H14-L1]